MTRLTTARSSPSSSRRPRVAIALLFVLGSTASAAALADEPAFMSGDWGVAACTGWNQDPVLTTELAKSWIKNGTGADYVMNATIER